MYPSCMRSTDYSKSVVYFVESKKTDTSTSPSPSTLISGLFATTNQQLTSQLY